jgi:hypothetical protein
MVENNVLIIFFVVSGVFLAIILAITLIIIYLGKGAFRANSVGTPKSFGLFFVRSNFYRTIAILLILYGLLVVVILDNQVNDKVITVLSSIAAFVLGGFISNRENKDHNE